MNQRQKIEEAARNLIDSLHEALLNGPSSDRGSIEAIAELSRELANEAREVGFADSVVAALDGVAIAAEQSDTDDADHLLPAVYQLEEQLGGEHSFEINHGSTDEDLVRFDLSPDYDRLLQLNDNEVRLLESGLKNGRAPLLVRVGNSGGYEAEIAETIEQNAATIKTVLDPAGGRVAAIVLQPLAPGFNAEVTLIVPEASIAIESMEATGLRGGASIAGESYQKVPPIRFETLPSSLEKINYLLEQVVRGTPPSVIDAFATELQAALSIRTRSLLDSIKPSLQEVAENNNRRVDIELEGSVERIAGEMSETLREALFEVIANAIVHGIEPPDERRELGKPERGRVRVDAYRSDGSIHFDVVDDGRGIDQRALQNVFTREGPPSGLVRVRDAIGKRLGGKVIVRRTEGGATVSIRLSARRGIFQSMVAYFGEIRVCVPSSLVIGTIEVDARRCTRDATGGTFLKHDGRIMPFFTPSPDGSLGFATSAFESGWVLLARFCGVAVAIYSDVEPSVGAAIPGDDGTYTVPALDIADARLAVLDSSTCM